MALSPLGGITYSHTLNTWGGTEAVVHRASGLSSLKPRRFQRRDSPTTPQAVFHADEIGGYLELVDALRAAGPKVEPAEEVEQAFFSVIGCFACHLYSTIK